MQIYEHSHEILNTSLDEIVLHISFSRNFCNMVKSVDIGENLKQNKLKLLNHLRNHHHHTFHSQNKLNLPHA